MSVVIDSDMLLLVLDPRVPVPDVPMARERVDHLLEQLSESNTRILVPTPVLAEVLVHADAATEDYIEILRKNRMMRIAPFDFKAAVECGALMKSAFARRRQKEPGYSRTTLKFDQQIIAIAKSENAVCIYSNNGDLRASAALSGIETLGLEDLTIPLEARQTKLPIKNDAGESSN